jgi:hypothetical protein
MARPAPKFIPARSLPGRRIVASAFSADYGLVLVLDGDRYTYVVNGSDEAMCNDPLPFASRCKTAAEFNALLKREGFYIHGHLTGAD